MDLSSGMLFIEAFAQFLYRRNLHPPRALSVNIPRCVVSAGNLAVWQIFGPGTAFLIHIVGIFQALKISSGSNS
jgi:hypothetical protein